MPPCRSLPPPEVATGRRPPPPSAPHTGKHAPFARATRSGQGLPGSIASPAVVPKLAAARGSHRSSSSTPFYTTHRQTRPLPREPPDPAKGRPDPWPPAAVAAGEAPAADEALRCSGSRAHRRASMEGERAALPPSSGPSRTSGGTLRWRRNGERGGRRGGGGARVWPPSAARARATRGVICPVLLVCPIQESCLSKGKYIGVV
jgi:hypothetical protein